MSIARAFGIVLILTSRVSLRYAPRYDRVARWGFFFRSCHSETFQLFGVWYPRTKNPGSQSQITYQLVTTYRTNWLFVFGCTYHPMLCDAREGLLSRVALAKVRFLSEALRRCGRTPTKALHGRNKSHCAKLTSIKYGFTIRYSIRKDSS